MINLSIQDKFDGLNKIDDLKKSIGKDYYGNNKLLWISKDGNRCMVEKDGNVVTEPSWLTWNRFFF